MLLIVVDYIKIERTLKTLDSKYSESMTDMDLPILFSKMSIIEFSGWIEQSMDQILNEYLNTHIVEGYITKYIQQQIKNNHGFHYKNNILKILSMTIGAYNLENILDKIDPTLFRTILNKYSKERNAVAHTHIAGITPSIITPSITLQDFKNIKPIITTIEKEINSLP